MTSTRKTTLLLAASAAALLAVPALATKIVDDRKSPEMAPLVVKASDIIGRKVKNAQGEDLGKVEDLAIDSTDGRVNYAVLSFGGFLGMGDKLFAIPFMALHHQEKECVLDMPKERLEKAPGFDKDHWPNFSDRKWGAEIYQFYGTKPNWSEAGDKAMSGIACDETTVANLKVKPSSAKSYDGRVTKVDGHAITIKTDDGDLCVQCAPSSFLSAQNCSLKQNDEVKVKAVSVATPTGLDKVLVATEIRKGDKIIVLRNDDGTPTWLPSKKDG